MKCRMCDIWKHPSDILKEIKAKELEILPRLKFINITGGEPFVRNDLTDIIEVAFKKSPRVVISTAGFHVDDILTLAEKFPNIGIRVSLEGLSTVNDHLRGRSSGFDRGMNTLLGLRQMGIKDIGIAMTVSHKNCHDLIPVYQLTRNLNMDFATATYHNSFYFHKDNNFILNKDEVTSNFFELADLLMKGINPKNWFRSFFNIGLINYILGNKRLLPCEAGSVNFFIEPYGEVFPCNGLEERYWKESMGNIRDHDSFEQLWYSPQAAKVRNLVKTCPKNCWMVGTAAPVMKKYIHHPLKWVLKEKFKSLAGKKISRTCLPAQYDIGQNPLQGDLRSAEQFPVESAEVFPISNDQRFMTKVLENIKLTNDTFLLRLEKGTFQFIPGQHVSIGPHLQYDKNRDYTFCSAPHDNYLEFLIKVVQKGKISPWLIRLKPGDKIDILGPYGDFFISEPQNKKYLFIATGVGIGPFLSFIKSYPGLDYKLIHGIRHKEDLILAKDLAPENYVSCMTRDISGNFHGRVTDYLKNYEIDNNTLCYICGNPYMLKLVEDMLEEKNLSQDKIFKEAYYAY